MRQKSALCIKVRDDRHHKPSYLTCGHCSGVFIQQSAGSKNRYCEPCRLIYYRVRSRAVRRVAYAIKKGILKPPKTHNCVDCEKSGRKVRADVFEHRDYRRPLKVDPVCHMHNNRRGPAKWAAPQKNLPKTGVSAFPHWESGEGDAGALL